MQTNQIKEQLEVQSEGFHVRRVDDLTIAEIVGLINDGESVIRTPHIGNFYIANLIAAAQGIPLVLMDTTYGVKDRNYHPHKVIFSGQNEIVADENLLTGRAALERGSRLTRREGRVGDSLAQFHMRAIQDAISGAHLSQYSEYLWHNRDLADLVMQIAAVEFPELWHRYVDREGHISERRCTGANEITQVFGIHSREEGWLIPSSIGILLFGVIEAVNHNTDHVYHISGPDLIVYINSLTEQLDYLYRLVRSRLQGRVQMAERLEFCVIPFAAVRFATTADRREQLDALLASQFACEAILREKEQVIRDMGGGKANGVREAIAEYERRIQQAFKGRDGAILACPEIFYDLKDGAFLSQYDVLEHGLYIPDWVLHTPLSEIQRVYDNLARYVARHKLFTH